MTFDEDKYASLFSCCITVDGASRSIICDLQRNSYITIPNALLHFTQNMSKYKLKELKELYSCEDIETIKGYLEVLLEHEYIFFTDNPAMFPSIDIDKWEEPAVITNAIIDVGDYYLPDFKKVFTDLAQLGCRHIQIRSFVTRQLAFFDSILQYTHDLNIHTIELIIKYYPGIITHHLEEFITKYNYISSLLIHSIPGTIDVHTLPSCHNKIQYAYEIITDESCCGCIHPAYFSINIKSFTESKQYNSCLNRKISIDKNGLIKNCPSLNTSFGSVDNISLIDVALNNEKLKELWKINKDQIKICRDCEFRYICTDCRAYRAEEDIYSKPLKCQYNPYTTTGFVGI